jgi:hypothetical protein
MQRRSASVVFGIVLVGLPASAAAQTGASWELSGGYSYLQDSPDRTNLPAGWMIGASVALRNWLSAVADISRHTHATGDIDLGMVAVLAGARASATIGPFLEFGQLVVGPARASVSVVGSANADTRFAVQPGAGIDYPFARTLAARLQIDFRSIVGGTHGSDPRHDFRFVAALVYRRFH